MSQSSHLNRQMKFSPNLCVDPNHMTHVNMTRILFLSFCLLLGGTSLHAQLQATASNTPPFTPQNLISNIFLGNGVEVSNITYAGDPVAVGYFTGGANVIGIDRGIILTSGRAAGTTGPFGCNGEGADFANNDNSGGNSDPNLGPLVGNQALNDVAAYTITFTPTSDTLRFRYCFASEEYPEYACSPYNDVFGFFISGPGFPTPTNIAYIPGTNFLPVTINNIHPANAAYPNCPPLNAQYYNDNNGSGNQPSYDGFTDVFVAQAVVQPCVEYTIRLVIADVGDGAYDSGVFLEAKSFGTGSLDATLVTASTDGTVTEGCAQGTLTFTLPSPENQATPIDFNVWGSADSGLDYQAIPSTLTIPAGETEISIDIIGLEDNVNEGPEFIAVDYQSNPCRRDTVYIFIRENSLAAPVLPGDSSICLGASLNLDGTAPVPLPAPPMFSNSNDIPIAPINVPIYSDINVFGVQPPELGPDVIRSVCVDIIHPFDDDIDLFLISPNGRFLELSTDNGGAGENYTNTCFKPIATQPITYGFLQAPANYAPFSGDFAPEGVWSDLWDSGNPLTNGVWRLQVVDDANGFTGTLTNWSMTFEPLYKIEYEWSPTTGVACPTCPITDITPSSPMIYVIEATDSYGCVARDSIFIGIKPSLPAPDVVCGDGTYDSVVFTWEADNNALGYEINLNGNGWIPVPNDSIFTIGGLPPSSSITAEVRGINPFAECPAPSSLQTCVNCSPPVVTYTTQPVSCFGEDDGSVAFTTDNSNPPYNYRVGVLSSTTGTINGLLAGDHIGVITDGLGCDTTINFTIGTPTEIVPTVTVQQNVSCFGGDDGALSVGAMGGVGNFSIFWNDPNNQITNTATGLSAGNYHVTLTDATGCSITTTGTVAQPNALTSAASALAVTCFGTATGSLQGNADGGTSPYTFVWTGNLTGQTVTDVAAGSYTVTVTDVNLCTATATTTIAQPPALTASTTSTPATCSDETDGVAVVTGIGGTAPYTYIWNTTPVQATATANNLLPQTYTVTVTDANQCAAIASATITSPAPLVVAMNQDSVNCNGTATGSATALPSGGNGTFTYAWNVPQVGTTITNLSIGTYTVTVTDFKGCSATNNITVQQPDLILGSGFTTDVSCFGRNDGSAKVDVTGGVAPYTYLWSTGSTNAGILDRPAGVYTVTITDANACTRSVTLTVEQPDQIVAALSPTPVLCYDGSTGTLSAQVTGGTGGYFVTWYGPNMFVSNEASLSGLYAGDYSILISDNSGCTGTASVVVTQPMAPLQVYPPLVSDTICFDASDGVADMFPIGGTTPYSYQWDDPNAQTVQYPGGLRAGVYRVTITDANGCYVIDSTYISQKNILFAYVLSTATSCYGGADGYAEVNYLSYGSVEFEDRSQFAYVWGTTPPQTNIQAVNLNANSEYSVTVTDADGCTATQIAIIGTPPELTPMIEEVRNVLCFGTSTGQALAVGNGGTAPYTYLWSPNVVGSQTDALADSLPIGTYRVTVTDAQLCTSIREVTLTQPPLISSTLQATEVACFGETTGAANATATGGVPPYTFDWPQGSTNLPVGWAQVTVTDANGCIHVDSVEVEGPDSPIGGLVDWADATCFGARDGSITISGSGGTPPYRYTLDNRPWNGSPIQIGLPAGQYGPQVQDANGCILAFAPQVVQQRPAVLVDLGPDITLELGNDTQIFADISNALDPYSLAWTSADSVWLSCLACPEPLVQGLRFAETFEVEVVDSLGCRGVDDINILVEKPRKVYVPTGFTPNGDATNDVLFVQGQSSAKILNFKVFDRWGEMVYEANDFALNDPLVSWDGTFRGQPMNPAVFVWVLEVEYLDGEREVLHGQTTLIR
jgi:gliding motility-associated-like protein